VSDDLKIEPGAAMNNILLHLLVSSKLLKGEQLLNAKKKEDAFTKKTQKYSCRLNQQKITVGLR
jgi:hypothetical protein